MKTKISKKIIYFFATILLCISCTQDEITAVLQEGPAPTATGEGQIEIAADNSGTVTVSPSAQGAFKFIVNFGDGTPPQTVGIGSTTTYTYTEEGTYTITVTSIAPNGKETIETFDILIDLTVEPEFCTSIFNAPVTWDDGNDPEFSFGFNGVDLAVVTNPDLSGANPQVSNVLQITQDGGGDFDGFGVQMTGTANFSPLDKVVRLSFWSNQEVVVRLALREEPNNVKEREVEVELTHTGSGWEELQFDFANAIAGFTGNPDGALGVLDSENTVPDGEYIRFQMFIAPGADVAGTFYLDNVGTCPQGSIPTPDPCTQIFNAPVSWDDGNNSEFEFGFNGVSLAVVTNPDLSRSNPQESNVLEITQDGGGDFDGFGVQMTGTANFSGDDKVVRLDFWSDQPVDVRLAVSQDPNNETAREVEVTLSHTGKGWQELRFDFANAIASFTGNADGALGIPDFQPTVPNGEYIRFQMFIAPGLDVPGTFYLDNVGICP